MCCTTQDSERYTSRHDGVFSEVLLAFVEGEVDVPHRPDGVKGVSKMKGLTKFHWILGAGWWCYERSLSMSVAQAGRIQCGILHHDHALVVFLTSQGAKDTPST